MIDETINKYFGPFAEFVSAIVFFSVPMFGTQIPLIVGWLIAAGIFFTFWLIINFATRPTRSTYTTGRSPEIIFASEIQHVARIHVGLFFPISGSFFIRGQVALVVFKYCGI